MTDAELIIKMREMVDRATTPDARQIPTIGELVETMGEAADHMETLVHDYAEHIVTTGRSFRR